MCAFSSQLSDTPDMQYAGMRNLGRVASYVFLVPPEDVRRSRLIVAVTSCVLATTVGLGCTLADAAAATPTADKPPSKAKIASAKSDLEKAADEVNAAGDAVDKAQAKLPPAQKKLDAANSAYNYAVAARARALDALKKSQQAVVAQKKQVAIAQAKIDHLKGIIASFARRAYLDGGQNQELQILLNSDNPSDIASQIASVKRVSQVNGQIFEDLAEAKAALAAQLARLVELEATAKHHSDEAAAEAAQAAQARNDAAAARNEIASLVAQREAGLRQARKVRNNLRAVYNRLLDQRAAALSGGKGFAGTTGTIRNARQAVNWAMQYVGAGLEYNHLCLGFVDAAYGARGARQPRAIDQWYAAKRAGKAHPGDMTPPLGAQVFWWSGNPARHIALYIGNGMVVSTGVDGGRVGVRSLEWFNTYYGPYLGWASAYYP